MEAPGGVEPPTNGLGNLRASLKTLQILPFPRQIPAKSGKIRNPDATERMAKRDKPLDPDSVTQLKYRTGDLTHNMLDTVVSRGKRECEHRP